MNSSDSTMEHASQSDEGVHRVKRHERVRAEFVKHFARHEIDAVSNIGKAGRIIGEPKGPGKARSIEMVNNISIAGYTGSYTAFNNYLLYSDPTTTAEEIHEKIPKCGVRLDDMTVALVLENITSAKLRNLYWPAEFDIRGMPRATRIPLGHAAKTWVSVGQRDVEGNVATKEDEGFYYLWWKGLQVLMGKEGHDAKLHMIRPSWEGDKCEGFGFKLTHKAVVQHLWVEDLA